MLPGENMVRCWVPGLTSNKLSRNQNLEPIMVVNFVTFKNADYQSKIETSIFVSQNGKTIKWTLSGTAFAVPFGG